MPSLPPVTSTPTLIDGKYAKQQQAAMAHIERTQASSLPSTKQRSKPTPSHKKPIANTGDHTMSPPMNDFVLFPDDTASRQCVGKAGAQQCEKSKPKRSESDVAAHAKRKLRRPRRKRTPRHGGFKIMPMTDNDNDDESQDKMKQSQSKIPPPAPSPPMLDSPCLSEVDEDDFWGCWRRTSGSEKPMPAA